MASLPIAPGTSAFAWKIRSGGQDTWVIGASSPADLPDGEIIDAVTISVSDVASVVNDVTPAAVGAPQPVAEPAGTTVQINFAPLFGGTNLAFELIDAPAEWSIDASGLAEGPIFTGSITARVSNSIGTTATQTVGLTKQTSVPAGFTAVNTPQELIDQLNADPAGKFYITTDMDVSGFSNWSDLINVTFEGTLDGGGHVLSGMKISAPGGFVDGLISRLGGYGRIRNLGLRDVDITAGRYVGAIVGEVASGAIIEQCFVTGTMNVDRAECGGIAGYLGGSARIDDCWTDVTLTQTGSEARHVGGIVGRVISATVNRCMALGATTSVSSSGTGTPGPVGGTSYSGVDNYFDSETTGFASDPHGTAVARTTASLQTGETSDFPNWSADEWQFHAGHYPLLSWQPTPVAAPILANAIEPLNLHWGDIGEWDWNYHFDGENLSVELIGEPAWMDATGYTAPDADSSGAFTVRAWNSTGEVTQEVTYTVSEPASMPTASTQTIYNSDPLIMDSADASTPVLPAFDFMDMGDTEDWAIPILWYRRPGDAANRELLRLEVPGESKHLIVRGQQARWQNGGSHAENDTLADRPVESAWNLTMVHISTAGSYTGVRVSTNGGPNQQYFTNAIGDPRFVATRLQVSACVSEIGFLRAPYDESNYALIWNGGAPQHLDQVDLSATSLDLLDHIKLYRTGSSTDPVGWSATDHPAFGAGTGANVWWWPVPTPQEAHVLTGGLAWTAPNPLPAVPTTTSKNVSPFTEPVAIGQTLELDFEPAFSSDTDTLEYLGDEPHEWVGKKLRITPNTATDLKTLRSVRGSNQWGEAGTKDFYFRPFTAADFDLDPAWTPDPVRLEVGQLSPDYDALVGVLTGYVLPITAENVSGPSWVEVDEALGSWSGRPDAPSSDPVVIRITDALGRSKDVTWPDVVAVAEWDRTSDVRIAPGGFVDALDQDLGRWIYDNYVPGAMLQIPSLPDGEAHVWTYKYPWPQIPLDGPPLIIRGEDRYLTKISDFVGNGMTNVILENITVDPKYSAFLGYYSGSSRTQATNGFGGSRHITFQNIEVVGNERTLTQADLDTGEYENDLLVAYDQGAPMWLFEATNMAIDDVVVARGGETIKLVRCKGLNFYNVRTRQVGGDLIRLQDTTCCRFQKCFSGGFEGNFDASWHKDLFQFIGSDYGRISAEDMFFHADYPTHIQGPFVNRGPGGISNSWWPDKYGSQTKWGIRFKRCLVVPYSPDQGIVGAWWPDVLIDQCIILHSPLASSLRTPIWGNDPIVGLVRNTIYDHIRGRGHDGRDDSTTKMPSDPTMHLLERENCVEMSASDAPHILDILPNWRTEGLPYDDPRDAVAAGQPPSQARYWIDPTSAWAQANPNIGPPWLRDGLTG